MLNLYFETKGFDTKNFAFDRNEGRNGMLGAL